MLLAGTTLSMPILLVPSRSKFSVFPTDTNVFLVLIGVELVAPTNGLDTLRVELSWLHAIAGFAVPSIGTDPLR